MKQCNTCDETKPLSEFYRLMSAAAYLLAHQDVLGEVTN